MRKKDSQNGSPRRIDWSSETQLSMKLHFGATLQGGAVSEQKKGPNGWHQDRAP